MEILSLELLGNPLLQWATATGAALLAIVALLILSRFVRTRLTTFAQKTDGKLDDALAAAMPVTHFWFIAAVALLCGAQFLHLPEQVNSIVGHVFTLALILQAGLWAHAAISGLLSGVMYALVALGFVLIYKASGVFNFAQGAMVYLAALSVAGCMEKGAPFASKPDCGDSTSGNSRSGTWAVFLPIVRSEMRSAADLVTSW